MSHPLSALPPVEWNATASDYPRDRCIQQLFEEQVERTPDAVAVLSQATSLTYRELNARANQLAYFLREQGVGPEVSVGICLDRSVEMIVGLLGVLKAGGAYVPLGPHHLRKRLAFVLQDTNAVVVLTVQRLQPCLPEGYASPICLDRDWEKIASRSMANPIHSTRPDNLAYVTYTSGSTGLPKGTTIPHRGVVRLVKNTNYADLNEQEVWLQFAPLEFDASTLEIWGSLLNGGRLVLFPPDLPSLKELGIALRQYGITSLWLTAGLFHAMVDEQLEDLGGLRQMLAGGDVLSLAHVKKFIRAHPHCRMVNGYGPTENTTFTCCYRVPPEGPPGSSVPIGRPIANTQVYLLDEHRQLVSVGEPGEMYIGGDGLARGYLNQPELTADRFIPNPFSSEPGARLHRTGDLARYLPDGNIEFIGRIDRQVKIRGFRVELGEIEAVLRQHPLVRDGVVIARQDAQGDKQLIAYVVPNAAPDPDMNELRAFLADRLPGYMVPSFFEFLECLPLTANGKVDHRALPAPDLARPQAELAFAAPRTPVEELVAGILAELLGVERMGIYDNFFDLGLHSLVAVRLLSRVRNVFKVEIPLGDLFDAPTIAEFSQVIEQARQAPNVSATTRIAPLLRAPREGKKS